MSNTTNDLLLERASEMKVEWEGTLVEDAINKALADKDLERLRFLVVQAEAETSRQDFYNYEVYGI